MKTSAVFTIEMSRTEVCRLLAEHIKEHFAMNYGDFPPNAVCVVLHDGAGATITVADTPRRPANAPLTAADFEPA